MNSISGALYGDMAQQKLINMQQLLIIQHGWKRFLNLVCSVRDLGSKITHQHMSHDFCLNLCDNKLSYAKLPLSKRTSSCQWIEAYELSL